MAKKYGVDTDEFDKESYNLGRDLIELAELNEPVTAEDIKFVLDTITKEAPHDKTSITQILLGMLSAFTKLPIHHAVSSKDAGAGKSYLIVLVSDYFPTIYIVLLNGMSDKAMLHRQGKEVVEDDNGELVEIEPLIQDLELKIQEQNDNLMGGAMSTEDKKKCRKAIMEARQEMKELKKRSQKLIVLENRIILLLDTTQDNLFNAMMSLVSQDTQKDQRYEFVDTNNVIVTKVNRFRGTPAIFTCQVIDDTRQKRYQEKNRRLIHVIPETTIAKIRTAKLQTSRRHFMLPEEYDEKVVSRTDKQKAIEIIERLVKKFIDHSKYFNAKEPGVRVPFLESIAYGVPTKPNDVWGMTVLDRIDKYLAVITKMHMDDRPRLIDTRIEGDKKFYPIATFEDLRDTLQLMGRASSTIRPYIADWYNTVFLPAFEVLDGKALEIKTENGYLVGVEIAVGVNSKILQEKTIEVMGGIKPSSGDLLGDYLYPLINMGIIDKVKSNIDARSYIYFPVESGNINTIFKDDKDLRLEIDNPSMYPSKTTLEECCRTIVKYYSKGGGVSTFEDNEPIYRLVDPEGIDISLDELIERYLSNPEIAFEQLPSPPLNNKNQQFSNNDIEENTWVVSLKPLEQWDASDFRSVGCIHCINNGGYHGPVPLTTEEYEWHIVNRHKPGTPAYPGPADIEKYGLKLPTTDSNGNGETKKSDLADIAETNLAGNGLMGSREGEEAG